MTSLAITDRLLRPSPGIRVLFLARHAPLEPDFAPRSYLGDGGYPAYYHRIWTALKELGYHVLTSNSLHSLPGAAGQVDLVFSLYNRIPIATPEIYVAAQCAFLGLACVGAGANIRALAEDKWLCKLAARGAGLPVAQGAIYNLEADFQTPPPFPGPYFIKNRLGAASEGITEQSIQEDWDGAKHAARRLIARGMAVLVEEYVAGLDVTLPVLGGETPLILGLVAPGSNKAGGIITEDLKKDDPLGYRLFDAGVQAAAFAADARTLWDVAGPIDYFRMDYRFDPQTGRRVFLEMNICCHIGRSGAICLAAAQHELSQLDILGHVVEASLRRHVKRQEVRP